MIYIIIILLLVGYWYGLSLFFSKAGKTSWHAFVPYLRIKALTEIFKKTQWKWILMSFIPVVNIFVYTNLLGEISNSIRKFAFWEHTLAVVFGWAWLPFVLSKEEVTFHGIGGVPEGQVPPTVGKGREWLDAILFAIFAAYFIRTFVFEIYTIPTSSMEGTLKVGDFLIVSKFAYGARVPNTPIAFPLVHHSFPQWLPILGGKKSYLEWIKLPYKRLPKIQDVKRNDMVVFNFPANDTTTKEYDSARPYYDLVRQAESEGIPEPRKFINERFTVISRPVDKRENYIKRCVGMPGDKLQVKESQLLINDSPAFEPEHLQFTYYLKGANKLALNIPGTKNFTINKAFLHKLLELGIAEKEIETTDRENLIRVYTDKNIAKEIETFSDVETVTKWVHNSDEEFQDKKRMYPNTDKAFRFNVDNYGPITIPYKGYTISLNKENYLMYERAIRVYENNDLSIKNGKAYLNGEVAKEYTFKMDYYWMMGDNRHRSQDSRYWGFVPEDHVVGKAWILIASMGEYEGFRFDRVFKLIHNNWAPKDSRFTD